MSHMRTPGSMPPAPTPGLKRIEQVYVTHCTPDDIVMIEPGAGSRWSYGFGVRACSIKDPALLRFAADSTSFFLPNDMGPKDMGARPIDPAQAPRRLALVQPFDNVYALVNTSYLPFDTSIPPRPGSYFSHILFLNNPSLKDALSSWAAPGWVLDYPQRATKDLPPLATIPGNGPINDAMLTAFLGNGTPQANAQDLATVVFPNREPLWSSEARRRARSPRAPVGSALARRLLRGGVAALLAGRAGPGRPPVLRREPPSSARVHRRADVLHVRDRPLFIQ